MTSTYWLHLAIICADILDVYNVMLKYSVPLTEFEIDGPYVELSLLQGSTALSGSSYAF
jgi:hypothetical protein